CSLTPELSLEQPAGFVPGIVGAVPKKELCLLECLGNLLQTLLCTDGLMELHATALPCLAFRVGCAVYLQSRPIDMKEAFASIIADTGENPDRPGLAGTPERAAKAF